MPSIAFVTSHLKVASDVRHIHGSWQAPFLAIECCTPPPKEPGCKFSCDVLLFWFRIPGVTLSVCNCFFICCHFVSISNMHVHWFIVFMWQDCLRLQTAKNQCLYLFDQFLVHLAKQESYMWFEESNYDERAHKMYKADAQVTNGNHIRLTEPVFRLGYFIFSIGKGVLQRGFNSSWRWYSQESIMHPFKIFRPSSLLLPEWHLRKLTIISLGPRINNK